MSSHEFSSYAKHSVSNMIPQEIIKQEYNKTHQEMVKTYLFLIAVIGPSHPIVN